MKSLILFFLLVCITNTDANSTIKITTNSKNAVIVLDDKIVSTGTYEGKVDAGIVVVRIIAELRAWNSEIITDTVTIGANETKQLNYKLSAMKGADLLITSIPGDAGIYNGEMLLGYTPAKLGIDKSDISITLRKKGFEPLPINNTNYKSIPFELRGSFPGKKNVKFTDSDWFYILLGSAAVLGASAAYLKAEADSNFDEYEKTGNPDFLDKTDRYDLYSGVALGVLQVNFGVLIYEFLTD